MSSFLSAGFLIAFGVADPEDIGFFAGCLVVGGLGVVLVEADPGLVDAGTGLLVPVADRVEAGLEDKGVLGDAAGAGLDASGTLGLVGADLGAGLGAGAARAVELDLVADAARGVGDGLVRGLEARG